VCVLVKTDRLQPSPGGFNLKTESFGAKYNLCHDQKYRDQPLLGYGSGFLVAPDIVATAGHCINEKLDESEICVLFDFEVTKDKVETFRRPEQIYYVAQKLKWVVEKSGADYGFIRLDRPVGIAPLSIAPHDPKNGTQVYVVGHPVGLPKKLAD